MTIESSSGSTTKNVRVHKLNPTLLNVILYDDDSLKRIEKFFRKNDTESISVWISADWEVVMLSSENTLVIEEESWKPDHEC